jgi:hypothetical protein
VIFSHVLYQLSYLGETNNLKTYTKAVIYRSHSCPRGVRKSNEV